MPKRFSQNCISSKITASQRKFMLSLQRVVIEDGGPVCVSQICKSLGTTDSRVRVSLKALMSMGVVCCVGRSKVKRYVPSAAWSSDGDASAGLSGECGSGVVGYGGECSTDGCKNPAVDRFRGRYLCRDCLIGRNDEDDLLQLRDQWVGVVGLGNPSRMMEES